MTPEQVNHGEKRQEEGVVQSQGQQHLTVESQFSSKNMKQYVTYADFCVGLRQFSFYSAVGHFVLKALGKRI